MWTEDAAEAVTGTWTRERKGRTGRGPGGGELWIGDEVGKIGVWCAASLKLMGCLRAVWRSWFDRGAPGGSPNSVVHGRWSACQCATRAQRPP